MYIPLVLNQLNLFGINHKDFEITGDHLGLQTLSKEEFDAVHTQLIDYCQVVKEGTIHNRRNNTYKLNDFVTVQGVELQSIEIFEPKPDANTSKLKAGYEHIALKVDKYDDLLDFFKNNSLPINKEKDFAGSKFFRTALINLVEVEFRNDYLWEALGA